MHAQASLQTLLIAQGQGMYGGQPMAMGGLGAQPQQQSTAMMRLMQLSNQGVLGVPLQAPAGQLMPGSTVQPAMPPNVQTMGESSSQSSLQLPGTAQP